MTDLIQTIARAMWDARERCLPERTRMKWEAGTDAAKSTCWLMTSAALTAINEAGLVIVPREPTEMMIDAGYLSCDREDWYGPRSCWEYMIGVAAITTGETGQ